MIQDHPKPHEATEHRDLAKGALVNAVGMFTKTTKAATLVLFPRLFGAETFGLYILSFAVVDILFKVAGLGLDWGSLRLVVKMRANGRDAAVTAVMRKVLICGLLLSGAIAVGMALGASFLATYVLDQPRVAGPLFLLCISIPLMSGTQQLLFAIRGARKMQYEVIVRSGGEPLALLVGGLVAHALRAGIQGLIVAQLISSLTAFLLSLYFFRKVFRRNGNPGDTSVPWRELFVYSLPMAGGDLLNNLKQRLDLIVIGRLLTLTDVGVYGILIEVANLIKKIRQAFGPIFHPIVTYLHEKKEHVRLQRHYALAVRWIFMSSLAFFLPMLFAPKEFLRIFGEDFFVGSQSLMILAFAQLIQATIGLSEDVLTMTGHPYANLANSSLLVVLNFVLLILFVPDFGLTGAAWATFLSITVMSCFRMLQVWRFLHIHPIHRALLKPLTAGSFAFGVAWLMAWTIKGNHYGTLFFVAPVFLLLYFFGLKLLGPQPEDREISATLKRRFERFLNSRVDASQP